MAFAAVGTLGTVQSATANQSTLVLTTSATLEAGNLGVIVIAVDNNQTTDGDESAVTGVVDSAGNTWTKGAEFTNGQGGAQAGATCSLWYKVAGTQLTSGGTITVSFSNNTVRDAAAATAHEFTIGAGATVSVEGTPATQADDNAAITSFGTTTANIECLRICGGAEEGVQTLSTWSQGGWTQMSKNGTTGGGAAGNMGVQAMFKISTGTADNAGGTGALCDRAAVYVALKETAAAKNVVAGSGTYTLTGTAATLKVARKDIAAVGTYSFTGTAATLRKNYPLVASVGTYTFAGTAASLFHKWILSAAVGTYTLTGTVVTLIRRLPLIAGPGSYLFTGTTATLRKTWLLSAGSGSYLLTGTAASLLHGYKLAAGVGTYSFNGTAVTLTKSSAVLNIVAGAGTYSFSGTTASLLHKSLVTAGLGTYIFSGTAASLLHKDVLSAGAGSYLFTGAVATLKLAHVVSIGGGSYIMTGSATTLLKLNRKIAANNGSYSLSGTAATLTWSGVGPVVDTVIHNRPIIVTTGTLLSM